jgi:thiosulfate/3-mercaptopyruvate sulfurtransferase
MSLWADAPNWRIAFTPSLQIENEREERGVAQEFLVTTDWLAERLGEPGIRIVDCRYSFERDCRADYDESHIPGAVYLDWSKDLTDLNHPVSGMIAPPEIVSATMQRLGVGDDTQIVAYDQEGGHFASRLWLVLARYGHGEQVKILDGGWTAWRQETRPVSADPAAVVSGKRFTIAPATHQPQWVADADDVLAAVDADDAVVLDVRRWSEFSGEEVRAARGGRVPGATFLFWQENLDWNNDRRFLPVDQLGARAAEAGLTPDTELITYCQGGVRAAHAAIALMLAGYEKVKVYDGSWAEWGNRDDLPIETGEPRGGMR